MRDSDPQEKSYEDFRRIAEELREIAIQNKVTIITATQMKPHRPYRFYNPYRPYRIYDPHLAKSITDEAQFIIIDYTGLLK